MKKINFEVEKADVIRDDPDSQFATARILAFSSSVNRHDLRCSDEVLKRTAPTIYNKPLLYTISSMLDDFESHNDPDKSLIAGFVEPDSAEFVEDKINSRISLFVNAKIWKRYAPKVIEIFKRDNANKKVSVEMELYELDEKLDSISDMLDFAYTGIALLGSTITEASPGANMQMLSFAKENEEYKKVYQEEFSKNSNWFNKVLKSSKNTKEDTIGGKTEKVFFTGDDKEKVEKMADKKELEEEKVEAKEKPEEEKKEAEEAKKEEMAAEEPKKEEVAKEEEKKFSLDAFLDVASTLAFLEEETEANEEMAEQVKMAADELRDKKEFAEPGKVMMGMFGKMKQLACKMAKIKEEQKAYMAENEELKKFKADTEAAQFGYEVNKTMAEVKEDLPKEEFEALQEKAKDFSIETIDGWKNAVRAKAYEFAVKNKNSESRGYVAVGLPFADIVKSEKSLWD